MASFKFSETKDKQRKAYLADTAYKIRDAAERGVFLRRPVRILSAVRICGPRAGALEFDAGFDAKHLRLALLEAESATLRQMLWPFVGEPVVSMSERLVRISAGWRDELADKDIPLSNLGHYPNDSGRWRAGVNERGSVVTLGLDDESPHWLIAGTTGSGKTTAQIAALCQLAEDPTNQLVLIDVGKQGKSFRGLENLCGLVGPIAPDLISARAALAWVVREMAARHAGSRSAERRVILAIDELSDLMRDSVAAELLSGIIKKGRDVKVHGLLAVQNPTVESLGGSETARNITGRMVMRVLGAEASRVAVAGKFPRADKLLDRGDMVVLKGSYYHHRIQGAWFDGDIPSSERAMLEWNEDLSDVPDVNSWPTGQEVAIALECADKGWGRTRYQDTLKGSNLPREAIPSARSNDRAVAVLKLAKAAMACLEERKAKQSPARAVAVRPSGS